MKMKHISALMHHLLHNDIFKFVLWTFQLQNTQAADLTLTQSFLCRWTEFLKVWVEPGMNICGLCCNVHIVLAKQIKEVGGRLTDDQTSMSIALVRTKQVELWRVLKVIACKKKKLNDNIQQYTFF